MPMSAFHRFGFYTQKTFKSRSMASEPRAENL